MPQIATWKGGCAHIDERVDRVLSFEKDINTQIVLVAATKTRQVARKAQIKGLMACLAAR